MLTAEYFREAAREYLLTDGTTLESALTILVEVSLRLRAEAPSSPKSQENSFLPETAANSQPKVPKLPTSTPVKTPVKTPAALDSSPQRDDPNMQPRAPTWSPTFYQDTPFIPSYEVESFESAIRSGLVPVKGPYGIMGYHRGDNRGHLPQSRPRSGCNSPQVISRPASPELASYYQSTGPVTPASPTRKVTPADNLRLCRDNSLRLYNLEAHTQAILDNVVFDYLMSHPEFTIDKINCSKVRVKKYGNFPHNVMAVHWASYCTRDYRTDLAESYCLEQKCQCRAPDVAIPSFGCSLTARTSFIPSCDREHWRFLVELTNGNFVYMRASCVGSFSKDGYIEAYLAKDPRELIASMTAAEYDDYDSFKMEMFEASFLE